MTSFWKKFVGVALGLAALGVTAASAGHRDYRPDPCRIDHDHRSHHADYYDYYPKDRYYRAGPYRGSGVSFSLRFGDDDDYYYDRRGHRDRYSYGRRYADSRVVNRRVYDTRYRARIVLVEEVVYGRRGKRLVCTVSARGPEARYVSERRMHRIARDECSYRARIRVLT